MGNDLCLAWPWAELAVMGAKGGRGPAPAGDRRRPQAPASSRSTRPVPQPLRGSGSRRRWTRSSTPSKTPSRSTAAFEMLASKQERLWRKHAHRTPCRSHPTWPTPSPSPTTAPESPSRYRSSTVVSTPRSGESASGTSGSTTPALMTTAATTSRPSPFLDGEAGILRYRGYPIEQLAEQLDLTWRSPTSCCTASCPTQRSSSTTWSHDITYHTFIHENMRKRFLEGFHRRRPPHGDARLGASPRCRPSTPTPARSTTPRTAISRSSG